MSKIILIGKFFLCSVLITASVVSHAQFHLGVFGGISNYAGDLTGKSFQQPKPAIGVTVNYEVSDRFMLRSGVTFATVAGADKYSHRPYIIKVRNLSFESKLTEFNLLGELTIFNLNTIRWSPYIFGGLAVFHFNPYTYDSLSNKVYLKPLSTEGQGLPQYANRKPYALTQAAIPFGAGIKYAINDNIRIGLESGLRKTFTDYLDDVSTNYVAQDVLLVEKGPQAVSLAYRGDEAPGGSPDYPKNGAQRGNPKIKDWYFFTGLHITFRLGGGYGRTSASGGHRKNYGCPANPL